MSVYTLRPFHVSNCCCSPLLSTRSKAHGCEKNDTQFISVTLLRMVQGNYRNNFCSDHFLQISINVEGEWGVGEGGRREQKLKGTRLKRGTVTWGVLNTATPQTK